MMQLAELSMLAQSALIASVAANATLSPREVDLAVGFDAVPVGVRQEVWPIAGRDVLVEVWLSTPELSDETTGVPPRSVADAIDPRRGLANSNSTIAAFLEQFVRGDSRAWWSEFVAAPTSIPELELTRRP